MVNNTNLEILVTKTIHNLRIPAHIRGYRYARQAVMISIENPEALNKMVKVLYPQVAEQDKTTASRVERAIRHAIDVSWDRADKKVLYSFFGRTEKVTNKEFIAAIADKLRLQLKLAS